MKNVMKFRNFRISGTLIFALALILSLGSCARKLTFQTSSVVPEAKGYVKVKKDNNDNYSIRLKTENLSDPDRLVIPKRAYMVWMDTERNGVKNVGQLKSSSGLFSKTKKSSLETATSFKPLRFFITGENASDISYPEGPIVLTTRSY